MSKNLKKQWRVQVRKSRAHKWVNKGLFETRSVARGQASEWRRVGWLTHVVPYVKEQK